MRSCGLRVGSGHGLVYNQIQAIHGQLAACECARGLRLEWFDAELARLSLRAKEASAAHSAQRSTSKQAALSELRVYN